MNQNASWTLGLLLGGQSRRMGQDKALIEVRSGVCLLEWVVEQCRGPDHEQSIPLLLSCAADSSPSDLPESLAAIPRVVDAMTSVGPLGGIEGLLAACETPWLVVIPCDMPKLKREHLDYLVAQAGDQDNWIRFETSGQQQTFPLALRPQILPQIRAALQRGTYKVRAALEEFDGRCTAVPPSWSASLFANLNNPEDLRSYLAEN